MTDDTPPAMTREELRELGMAALGTSWQSALARERGVNERTVRYWVARGIDRPDTAAAIRDFLRSRRVIHVPGPSAAPAGVDRAEAATRLVDAIVEIVLDGAQASGWTEREITVALYAVLVDRLVAGLDPDHARELLEQAIDQTRGRVGS